MILFSACLKTETTAPEMLTGTVADINGNVYKTVKIGNQWWMSENLKVKNYRDGSPIRFIGSDSAEWRKDSTGAYSNYSLDTTFLYNYFAVSNPKSIAPIGWHVPSDDEWKVLEIHLGMNETVADKTNWRGTNESEKLKVKGPLAWTIYNNVWGTNESGFSALPVVSRFYNGNFLENPGSGATAFWWSSSEHDITSGWYRHLDYKASNIFRFYGEKNYGFSIRCIKD